MKPQLFEITALVSYSIVIRALTKEQAMEQIKTWEHAWDSNADLVGVSDVDLFDVREGDAEDAHIDLCPEITDPEYDPCLVCGCSEPDPDGFCPQCEIAMEIKKGGAG